ncbi:MAG: TRAP transporter large permease subunit [Comamonas sp.]
MEFLANNMAPIMFAGLICFLLLGFPVAFSLGACGLFFAVIGIELNVLPEALMQALPLRIYGIMQNETMLAIPFFTLMGLILERSGMAEDLLDTVGQLFGPIRGGVAIAVILVGAMLAATTGVVAASVISMGLISLPIMLRYGYDRRIASGVIAASGTLAQIIPPSLVLIILADQLGRSVGDLYKGAFIPGFMLASLFILTIIIACVLKPEWGGKKIYASWGERFRSLVNLLPPLGIFFLVVGSIYAGLATPTEAAALGVFGALVLAAFYRRLSLNMLREAIEGTMKSTAMIMLIVIAAAFLNFVMSATGLTNAITDFIGGLGLSSGWMLLVLVIFYLVLGCFMETLSMMITTIPIVAPVMIGLGYDPVWLGIMIIILVEAALITPPVGMNLFVVQSLRKSGSMNDVIVGSLPFVAAMFVMLLLLALFPAIAMWMPTTFG